MIHLEAKEVLKFIDIKSLDVRLTAIYVEQVQCRAAKGRRGLANVKWQINLEKQLIMPQETAPCNLREDVLWYETRRFVYVVEMTVPWEDAEEITYKRKKLRYTELATVAETMVGNLGQFL